MQYLTLEYQMQKLQSQQATRLNAAAFCSQNRNYKRRFSPEMSAVLIRLQTATNTQKFSQLQVASVTVVYVCV